MNRKETKYNQCEASAFGFLGGEGGEGRRVGGGEVE